MSLEKTHWVVVQHGYFTGNNFIVERRKTRLGALKARTSRERFADSEEFMFEIMRSDEAETKKIT